MKRIHKLLGIGLVVVSAALTGCSSNDSSQEFTGAQLVQGMMGYGPAAKSFGDTGSLQDRLDHTKTAIKNHAIPPELLQNYIADLKPAAGDPLPAPTQPSLPTEAQLEQLAQAVDMVQLPTEKQFQTFVGYLIDEINHQAPGYLDRFAADMQSGDAGRVAKAMKVMQRTMITVFESKDLAARVKADPTLASVAGSLTKQNTGSGGDTSGDNTGNADSNAGQQGDQNQSKGVDPVVVPNQLPNSQNTVTYDQYALGTRVAAGAYVGAVVVVAAGAVVWVAAVKGLGPFIPLANMHDQNPGDSLSEEMSVANVTRNLSKGHH
jgi:hypothetical protein